MQFEAGTINLTIFDDVVCMLCTLVFVIILYCCFIRMERKIVLIKKIMNGFAFAQGKGKLYVREIVYMICKML